MLRGLRFVTLLILGVGLSASAGSFDFYRAGPTAVGLFTNLTGRDVTGLALRFSGAVEVVSAVGIGANMTLAAASEEELIYSGFAVPNGTWEVDWLWDEARLEYAAWVDGDRVVEEIDVHSPTASFGIHNGRVMDSLIFSAQASQDPDGDAITRYRWLWSDGVVAEGSRVQRPFLPGIYDVLLTVWDHDGNSSSSTRRFHVRGGFFTLSVFAIGSGAVQASPFKPQYAYGERVTITAIPSDHWEFAGWLGGAFGSASTLTVRVTGDTVMTALFDPHAKMYTANGGNDTLSVIDLVTHSVITTIPVAHQPNGVAICGDKVYVSSEWGEGGGEDFTVSIIDTVTDTVIQTITAGPGPQDVECDDGVAYIPCARYNRENSDTIAVIDTATDTVIDHIPVGRAPIEIAIDNGIAYTADFWGMTISEIDLLSGTLLRTISVDTEPQDVAIVNENKLYMIGWPHDRLWVIDRASGSVTHSVAMRIHPQSVTIEGDRAYVPLGGYGGVWVMDTNTDTVIKEFRPGGYPSYVAIRDDLAYVSLYSNATGGGIAVVDLDTYGVVDVISLGTTPGDLVILE